jgi:hypothetical protein
MSRPGANRKEWAVVQETNEGQGTAGRVDDPALFYRKRQRVSMALLLFVVIAGLPIVGVPQWRHRLSERVSTLKTALSGEIKPATLEVGANNNPFPREYENPEPVVPKPPVLPPMDRVFTAQPSPPVSRPRPARETARIKEPPPSPEPSEPAAETPPAAAEPRYQQGKTEEEAYDLLLSSNPKVAGMVRGSDPSLKFKSWDALGRGDDVYWVRLKFQSEEDPDAEYIWQVKIQSKEITPLSHNARTLP